MKNSKSKINDILTAVEGVKLNGLNGNTVLGEPVFIGNDVIIPVSKITTCVLGGGSEYGKVKLFSNNKTYPFAGGSGSLVNVTPTGFLIGANGKYDFIKSNNDIYDKIAEKTFDIIGGLNEEN